MSNLRSLINGDRINLERLSFLLLDDNLQSLDVMGQIVSGFGVRTMIKCQTVKEAQASVGRTAIDFVLADAHLPEEDGFSFIQWVRREAREPTRFAPAVMVSGNANAATVHRARDAGAHFTIAKPITPKVLLQRIFWIARENRMMVETETYVGPDRRFKRLGPPPGLKGRRSDDVNAKLGAASEPNLSQDEINALMKPSKVAI